MTPQYTQCTFPSFPEGKIRYKGLNIHVQSIGSIKQNILAKIAIIFLSISLSMCFGYSKEPSHRDGSFEYPQHMFWLRNKKNNFQLPPFI